MTIQRRRFLLGTAAVPAAYTFMFGKQAVGATGLRQRVRPFSSHWPKPSAWEALERSITGKLIKPEPMFAACVTDPATAQCTNDISHLKNPFYLGDHPAGTQVSGWLDAWTSTPSEFVVLAENSDDVAAAVTFAAENNLRLVVKGGGHSYQGASNAPDSLLIWTKRLNELKLHDEFIPASGTGRTPPEPAVTVGSGAIWADIYDAVTTKAGRYVQGGGCTSVGVAGLVQSGGFGSFSKYFGMVAAGLLEAEIITADGRIRTVNAYQDPDLFWAIKGGGGGAWGVVTKLTLKTHSLPADVGVVQGKIKAQTDTAFRRLITEFIAHYETYLFNRHWGEKISLDPGNTLSISMESIGLSGAEVEAAWLPFKEWVQAQDDLSIEEEIEIQTLPTRHYWDPNYYAANNDNSFVRDPRPGSPAHHVWWKGDSEQAGAFIVAYESTWLPKSSLASRNQSQLAEALINASRLWSLSLHLNKGLAGAAKTEIDEAADLPTNPAVADAFALVIISAEGSTTFINAPDSRPDLTRARKAAQRIDYAMRVLKQMIPTSGAYVAESSFYQKDWQDAYWGDNYQRLRDIKDKFDPSGLFFVNNGVGAEDWSRDGFMKLKE
ncbi:MAG: FAD-dependent oxidoreductase [Pseudomonadota bacterium]